MGKAHRADAQAAALVEVIGHHGHHVTRGKGMQVELAGDGKDDGLLVARRLPVLVGQRLTRTSKEPELSTK